jgi:ribosome-associated toxin RatA of RatAB toxin-antitoxin module
MERSPHSFFIKEVHKSILIWYSAEEMYKLVTDVTKYPEFLPWCDKARVIEQDAGGMTAEVGLAFSGFHHSFTTRNTHVPGREVHLRLVDGPFSNLDGVWKFTPVGEEGERACRVELNLSYGFNNFALQALVGPVFDKIASNLVEAFVKRAEHIYC